MGSASLILTAFPFLHLRVTAAVMHLVCEKHRAIAMPGDDLDVYTEHLTAEENAPKVEGNYRCARRFDS